MVESGGRVSPKMKDFWVSPEILIKAEQMEKEADMIGNKDW